jgi:hypothetical protein
MTECCRIVKGQIIIVVGKRNLKFATEHHPEFWNGSSASADGPYLKIDDISAFQREFVNAINAEREDGSSLLTDMWDAAIKKAVEDGCEGIDHDWIQPSDSAGSVDG